MKKVFCIMVLLSIFIGKIVAVGENGFEYEYQNMAKQLTPLSPQASMMQRFGNYPVDYSTGVPKISIPLYTIKVGDFELPISIDYHNSGIRVQDMATQIGLGWVLNAGGCISVTVKGGYDINQEKGKPWSCRQEMEDSHNNIDESMDWAEMVSGICGDMESDRYRYNFCGNSGVFRRKWSSIDKSPEFVFMPYSDMQIEMKDSQYYREVIPKNATILYTPFVLTDCKGIKYHFDFPEISACKQGSYVFPYTVTYYLTKIELPTQKDSIVFHYSSASFYETYNCIAKEEYGPGAQMAFSQWAYAPGISSDLNYKLINDYENKAIIYYVRESKLDYIEWNGNKICFEYKDDRKENRIGWTYSDKSLKRLTSATVMNSQQKLVKSISFDNNSYSGTGDGDYRMFLRSVSIMNNNSSGNETYSFEYNNAISLPNYYDIPFTYNRNPRTELYCYEDFWGYYNSYGYDTWLPKDFTRYNKGANRWPSEWFALAGSLKSVTYPTGGKTVYDMENNRLDDGTLWGGLRVRSVTNYDSNGNEIGKKNYIYKNHFVPVEKTELRKLFQYVTGNIYSVYNIAGATCIPYFVNYNDLPHEVTFSSPCISLSANYGAPVYYQTVYEYNGTKESNHGYTKYEYINGKTDDMDTMAYRAHGDFYGEKMPYKDSLLPVQFFSEWENFDFGNTKFISKSINIYDNKDNLLSRIENKYDQVFLDTVSVGFKVRPIHTWHNFYPDKAYSYYSPDLYNPDCHEFSYPLFVEFDYTGNYPKKIHDFVEFSFLFRNVRAVPSYKRLAKQNVTQDGLTTVTEYSYDSQERMLTPVSKTVRLLKNDQTAVQPLTTTYIYPFESSDAMAQKMTDANMLVPLKTTTTRNGTVVRTDSVAYGTVGNGIQPKEYYTATGGERLEKRLTYTYDSRGRVQSLTTDAGECTVFVWGNRNDWPIAKIEGKTLEEIRTCIGEGQYQNMFSETPTEYMLYASKDKLQAHNCTMTIYSHETLVGVKSIIHPNNNTETFDYDGLGRLLHRNENNKLCEEYQYNYRKQ